MQPISTSFITSSVFKLIFVFFFQKCNCDNDLIKDNRRYLESGAQNTSKIIFYKINFLFLSLASISHEKIFQQAVFTYF